MSLIPKEQWRIKSAWEAYWNRIADTEEENDDWVNKSYLPTSPLLGYGYARDAFMDNLYQKRRILFLGNGISSEPLDYYFSGFDVTVVDISETACNLFAQVKNRVCSNVYSFLSKASEINLSHQTRSTEDITKSSQFIYRAGGSIEVICADMFDWNPQIKWHYIHNKLAFLAFSEEDQKQLLSRYFQWLEDGGHLQISYYYGHPNPFRRIADEAKKIGFIIRNEEMDQIFKESIQVRDDPVKVKELWLEYKRCEYDKDTLVVGGGKMLWVIWGSSL